MATVEGLCREWARWNLTRADAVVAVGGGVVTDTGGFAAAVYHRGVAVVHVPTTLLGMVDAAIGGKTGVNLPEGKNLVGAFWQPTAVLCDTDSLEYAAAARAAQWDGRDGQVPLPRRRTICRRCRSTSGSPNVFASRQPWSPATSASPAAAGLLNYGHTLAHALETAGSYDLRHGEAVGIGLVFAAELARHARPHRR